MKNRVSLPTFITIKYQEVTSTSKKLYILRILVVQKALLSIVLAGKYKKRSIFPRERANRKMYAM